ncbi:MAG TPA: hypothetical protein DEG42_02630 [Acholeplasmataceae bacterium]|nr:hypothetical protein [Acholeplasmataceae bacterium]
MIPKAALILAAGASTRFGKNKLLTKIGDRTLPQQCVEFAINNGMDDVYVTISKRDFFFLNDHKTLTHPIIESLSPYDCLINLHYQFQNEEEKGPGAAIKVWQGIINKPFVCLFGDNYYSGSLPYMDFNEYDCFVSYRELEKNSRNLQLAYLDGNIVIEKPHAFTEGKFFCGYTAFSEKVFDQLNNCLISGRGEYEITDLINFMDRRCFLFNSLVWGDITFAGDEAKIVDMIGGKK